MSWAGILTAAAMVILSTLMGRSGFGRVIAVVGVITGAVGIITETLRPVIGADYLVYGVLLPVWFALVGWKLLGLRRKLA
ncbi:hypothetical protein GCM10009817_27570 [Terrabacter lapilli]|uniref:Uncharacterized protein n=1 Tax=Terrabacter lapilli TaxID=436231 RepID=A0ABN2SEM5_9MICO